MDKYQETFETWNKLALLYEEKFMGLDIYNHTYDLICETIVQQYASILDVGCGPGNIAKYLLSKRPDFNILGIDVAPGMVDLACKNNPSAQFSVLDIRQIDTLNATFDAMFCGFCIPYLSQNDCNKLIHDGYNLLKKNGLIYLSFVEGDALKSGFQVGITGGRSYFYYHNADVLNGLLIESGFQIINTSQVEYKKSQSNTETHTIIISRK